MKAIRHTTGDRVHVLVPPVGPGSIPRDADWVPGEVLDAHILFGRPRYVVLLDDDRRLVASAYQIRTRPPVAWADAAMSEALDMAC